MGRRGQILSSGLCTPLAEARRPLDLHKVSISPLLLAAYIEYSLNILGTVKSVTWFNLHNKTTRQTLCLFYKKIGL